MKVTKTITIRINPLVLEDLAILAKQEGRPFSNYIVKILTDHVYKTNASPENDRIMNPITPVQ